MNIKEITETLKKKDVTGYTKKKNGLTYLSWAHAWREVLKEYPKATYKIKKKENGECWFGNDSVGYMVYTSVTIEDITHEMWLPVMDNRNISMKSVPYKAIQYGKEKQVEAMSTFEINKAVMRCLTKNLAMFGLGIHIYAGEDLPEQVIEDKKEEKKKELEKPIGESKANALKIQIKKIKGDKTNDYVDKLINYFGVENLSLINTIQMKQVIKKLKGVK